MSDLAAVQMAVAKHCTAQPPDTVFTQDSLLKTGLIPGDSVKLLHEALMNLTRANELKLMQRGSQPCWRCVDVSVRSVHKSLDPEALLIYNYIEAAGREGLLANMLNRKTNYHKATLDKCIKTLEQRRLIKTVANYRYPKRKTFMLWGLQPAEDVTGGPFYSGGELDEEFVNILCWWIERWVIARSWWFPPERARPAKKRQRTSEEPDREPSKRTASMRPFPPSYSDFPGIGDITTAVNSSGMAKETMKISDVQQLVDILCWDGKLERSHVDEEVVFRAVKQPFLDSDIAVPGVKVEQRAAKGKLGLVEAPCGQCPVFDQCQEGGLVSAQTCVYFDQW